MFNYNFKQAWRNLIRERVFSLINVIGLSIGMTSCLVITIFVRYESGFDQYHPQAERIYKVVQETKFTDETKFWNTTAYPLAEALRADFTDLQLVTQSAGPIRKLVNVENEAGKVIRYNEDLVLFVDSFFTKMFPVKWLAGNPTTALREPYSIVLTKSIANKYFDTPVLSEIVGRQIALDNKDELTISGVVDDAPANSSLKYSLLIPYEFFRKENHFNATNWSGNYQGTTFVMLRPTQSTQLLEAAFGQWKKKYLKPEDDHRITYRLQHLMEAHTDPTYGEAPGGYVMPQKLIYAATGIGFFILAIACINFINLATAQSSNRAKEVTVRKILGSSRRELLKQFLSENLLLVCVTLILSLALTQLSLSYVNRTLSIIDLNLQLDGYTALAVFTVGTLVILLASFYPAVIMSSYRPMDVIQSRFNKGSQRGLSLRRALIVFQFSVVQLLIIGTVVVASQMDYFKNKDIGFYKDDAVVMIKLPAAGAFENFRQRLVKFPGIAEVTFATGSPMSDYNFHYGTTFRLPGQPMETAKEAEMKGVDLSYIAFYKLRLLAGRNFTSLEDTLKEFVVNEKLIQAMGWTPEEALGRQLLINEGKAEIIGVVKDFHNNSLQDNITPCVMIAWKPFLETAAIKLESGGNLTQALADIEAGWNEFYGEWVFNFTFLDDAMAQNYQLQELVFQGFKSFGFLTIGIGCLGLYGLMAFITIRKTKEVGIRKVLGASAAGIFSLFSREFMILILISFGVAAPISYYLMNQWLQDFSYRIELSWWIFAIGVIITLGIALLTTAYHCLKAAYANPVDALRNE